METRPSLIYFSLRPLGGGGREGGGGHGPNAPSPWLRPWCGIDLEDLIYSEAECSELQSKRNTILRFYCPQEYDKTKLVGEIIFENNVNLETLHKK